MKRVTYEILWNYNLISTIITATLGEFFIIAAALFLTIQVSKLGISLPLWNWAVIVLGICMGVLLKWISDYIRRAIEE